MDWGSLIGGVGSLAGGFMGGGQNTSGGSYQMDPELLKQYYQNQVAMSNNTISAQNQQLDWMRYYYPQMRGYSDTLSPLLQQKLQNPGLPPELDTQLWNMARQQNAVPYQATENQLGTTMASNNMLRSGPTMNAWLNKIAIPRSQSEQNINVNQALAHYNAQNSAIAQAQTMMGMTPSMGGGAGDISGAMSYQQPGIDYSGLGKIFGQFGGGIGNLFGQNPGTGGTGGGDLIGSPGWRTGDYVNPSEYSSAYFK